MTREGIDNFLRVVFDDEMRKYDEARDKERADRMREDMQRRADDIKVGLDLFIPFVCDNVAAEIYKRMQKKHSITVSNGDLGFITLAVVMSAMGRT